VNKQQAGLDEYNFVHLIACCNHFMGMQALLMPTSKTIIRNTKTPRQPSKKQKNHAKSTFSVLNINNTINRINTHFQANHKHCPQKSHFWDSVTRL
jgi:hypothetical protein